MLSMPRPAPMNSPRTSMTRAKATTADRLTSSSKLSRAIVTAAAGIVRKRQKATVAALRSIRRVYDIEHGIRGAIAGAGSAEAPPHLVQRECHLRPIVAIGQKLHRFSGNRLRSARILDQLHDHAFAGDQVHHRVGID